jgi:hypothetical protein
MKKSNLEELQENVKMLAYVSGENDSGQKCFCYVMVNPVNFHLLKQVEGEFDAADFGEVLISGEGEDLDDITKKKFLDKFGVEFNFREKAKEIEVQAIEEYKKFFERRPR